MPYYEYPDGEVHYLTFALPPTSEGKRLSDAEGKRKRQAYACAELRKMIKPGTTVYTIMNHVSSSGMQRAISMVVVHKGAIRKIDGLASDAMGYAMHKKGGLSVGGCGMDTGFHLVYGLGGALWPMGTRKPHGTRNGTPDSAGGYALRHEWL